MRRLVTQLKKANATMVKEFYNEALEELDTPFAFRGVSVDVYVENICDYYGSMNPDLQGNRGMRAAVEFKEILKPNK